MSKSRDIADSAATINYIDNVTSDVQSQIDNISVTNGTLTKTFALGESATISLTSSVLAPVVSVTKEVPQTGVTNNNWDVSSTTENYTRLDSAAATTLDWVAQSELAAATFESEFYMNSQDTSPQAITFNGDGSKMYMVGEDSNTIYEYELSSNYEVSTSSYSGRSFTVTSQETEPRDIKFNNDGSKFYLVGSNGDAVYQYSLSAPYLINTASYDSVSFSVASQATLPLGISFNPTGTKMYIADYSSGFLYQYSLSSAWNLSTASYDSISLSAGASVVSGEFNNSGTKLYTVRNTTNVVKQWSLSTAYDISTASDDNVSFTASQSASTTGLLFSPDDTKMYVTSQSNDDVYQYSLAGDLLLTLGTGSFATADVGKTIEANSGVFVLTATDGSYVETTAPTSYDQVASGSWEMYGVVYNTVDGDLELSGYAQGYSISSASYDSKSFTVASQETSPYFCKFDTSGLSMYVGGKDSDTVFQYTLTIAFDISTAGYASISKSLSAQSVTRLQDIAFKTDGTKMYVFDDGANVIYQYSLSTAWNVSTATYDSVSFSLSSVEWLGLQFSSDGSKLFVLDLTDDAVFEYALSTPWVVSSASYVGSFVITQESAPIALGFNADGTKMFVAGTANDTVYQYSLASAWSLSGATYDSISFSVAAQDTAPVDITFNNDGTKMFIVGNASDTIYQYSTISVLAPTGYQPVHTTASTDTTNWTDINSMTADQAAGDGEVYYAISTDDRTTWTVIDNTDGERDIVRNNAGTWQYNSNGTYASQTWVNGATNTELATLAEAMEGASELTGGFDVSTASYDSVSFSVASQETTPRAMAFNTDGTKMFVAGSTSDAVHEYNLSTAFNISTASFIDSFSVSAQGANPYGLTFSSDGTKMFTVDGGADDVNEYTLSTGFDISTASFSQALAVESNPSSVTFNNDGTKMFIVRSGARDEVVEYTLSTAFDISTSSLVDDFNLVFQDSSPWQLAFNTDGTKMFIVGLSGKDVNEYTLSTGFDISTASFVDSFSVNAQETAPFGLAFNNDGTKMYICGNLTDSVLQYSMGTTVYTNQMDKTQLDAVTDPNHIALGNDLDLAIVFNMTSGSTVPSSDGVAINYDANILNKGAVLGTDYDFDAPAQNSVRITALAGNNLKVRVV